MQVTTDEGPLPPYGQLGAHPDYKRYIGKILQLDNPEDENAIVWLDWHPDIATGTDKAANLMVELQKAGKVQLKGGHDGGLAGPDDLAGQEADPDDPIKKATGLAALGEIDDIAIVALPDGGTL